MSENDQIGPGVKAGIPENETADTKEIPCYATDPEEVKMFGDDGEPLGAAVATLKPREDPEESDPEWEADVEAGYESYIKDGSTPHPHFDFDAERVTKGIEANFCPSDAARREVRKNSLLGGHGEKKLRAMLQEALPIMESFRNPETFRIIEIGTHKGISSCILSEYGQVTTFDIKKFEPRDDIIGRLAVPGRVECRMVKDDHDLARALANMDFDLAFVDGGHKYKAVVSNFKAVKKCGRVLFHDYVLAKAHFREQVIRAINEIPDGVTLKRDPFALWLAE